MTDEKPKVYDPKNVSLRLNDRPLTGFKVPNYGDQQRAAIAAVADLKARIQEAVFPTPTNRHERRAAAAKARKGGWR